MDPQVGLNMSLKVLVLCLFAASVKGRIDCKHRDFGNTGTVCVCDADHCDTIDPIKQEESGKYTVYTSNLAGKRFERKVESFISNVENAVVIDHAQKYQTINGFGGAFTDAAGININSLDARAKEHLMRSYFSDEGIEYSLGRVPIGGTDFGTRSYSYLDTSEPDLNLSAFSLQDEDFNYKIPLIRQALNLTNDNLHLFASVWTAPAWMKSNGQHNGTGSLKDEYYQLWVDYFVKFFDSYKDQGIEFWGLTTGNEPSLALVPSTGINTIGWTPWTQRKWIKDNLGPTIRNSAYKDLKLICHDDQRVLLPFVDNLFSDLNAKKYIDGIGVHWYWDDFVPASWQSDMHKKYPDKFFLYTEACIGDKFWEKAIELGSWERGERYAKDIVENLQHWSTGWMDWNMALDMTGGPTYINNNVDSPVIVNKNEGEFYKQPIFYALGHYSKFIKIGSVRIGLAEKQSSVHLVAFDRPDGATVVVAINGQDVEVKITLRDPNRGDISEVLSARSFNTIIYW